VPWAAWLICLLIMVSGCAPASDVSQSLALDQPVPLDALLIPGDREWIDTGVDVTAGEPITITAGGQVRVCANKTTRSEAPSVVGPQGTYFYGDLQTHETFPMPAAGNGPAPCYCLIGRIGAGQPFYVGPERSWVVPTTGRLWLGINDYDPRGNAGAFHARVLRAPAVSPVALRMQVSSAAEAGGPPEGCRVVVFYIDGLRPDVVEEMAAMGHVPHLKKHFVEGGTWMMNAFTAFPSDTITSNGTMWTGCFSDRHGLKGQVRFSRRRLTSDSFLEPMGPGRSSRQLGPQGLEKVVHETAAATIGALEGQEAARAWRGAQTSAIPALYDYLRAAGEDWATGALPIMTDLPPVLWTRSMARFLPYLKAHEAWKYMDDANTHYALRHLLRQQRPVTIIWLPETDSFSHKECRGQFGSTRRIIARADRMVGEVVQELEASGRLANTYLVLVSDHGHVGGRTTHLARFDLANEFFFSARKITRSGIWAGGGLGLSVKQHRYANWHKEDSAQEFVFVDGDSDGAARIYLPKGGFRSRDWSGPNTAAELLAYSLADHLAPVNLPQTLASATALHDNGQLQHPIDLVLMKLHQNAILITTCDRGMAMIDRAEREDGRWVYRYTPLASVQIADDGQLDIAAESNPRIDPLGLVARLPLSYLQRYHDEQAWLKVTAQTEYPDAVVTLTRHMLWRQEIAAQEAECAPDLVVTARNGWLFGVHTTPGTTHGYPLAEAMRATWYIAGPNVRRGARIAAPCRLVDLTPTLLLLTGTPANGAKFDGQALRNIFEGDALPTEEVPVARAAARGDASTCKERPVYWRDVDLGAWQPLSYQPAREYQGMPLSINQPECGWDLNNLAYNALAIGDWSVFRLVDDLLSPLTPGRTKINQSLERVDQRAPRLTDRPWIGEGIQVLDLPGMALADYSFTSAGNLKRVDHAVDWLQGRGASIDARMSRKVQRESVLGTPLANRVIDGVQGGFWEAYRFGQRVAAGVLDEVILNGIENRIDRAVNYWRITPAEEIVDEP
jgi:hypothetical protein